MDTNRKRQLKQLGKAEVIRQSAEIHAALKAANPCAPGEEGWSKNYKAGTLREKWLQKRLPLLHRARLEKLFVVVPNGSAGWRPTVGGYVQCLTCGSASPTIIPHRFFYWAKCECGNISWRIVGPWRRVSVQHPEQTFPVKLIGKG